MGKALGVSPVPTSLVPSALLHVRDKIDAVYKKTHFWMPKEQLAEHLMSGVMQLWLVGDGEDIHGVFCTRTVVQYDVRVVEITLYSGTWNDEIQGLLPEVEEWAASIGAHAVRLEGREPWKRMLKKSGYALEHVAMFKLLKDPDA